MSNVLNCYTFINKHITFVLKENKWYQCDGYVRGNIAVIGLFNYMTAVVGMWLKQ